MFDNIGVLIHTVDLEISQYLKKQLAPYRLAPEQYLVLALLREEEGLSQNQIAEQLGKDKSGIARMIASLENKGFIRRSGGSQDRRSVEVYLTDQGRELGQTARIHPYRGAGDIKQRVDGRGNLGAQAAARNCAQQRAAGIAARACEAY
ncbi:MarR family transcriptional regulator [Paenibacillus sp. JTLBN-2024]